MVYETAAFTISATSSAFWCGRTSCSPTWTIRRTMRRSRGVVALEAQQLLQRLQGRPSIAVLCGNSEVGATGCDAGLPLRAAEESAFRRSPLAGLVKSWHRAWHGFHRHRLEATLPFQADRGVTHYYGVGAYLRPLDDARRASVRFAAECLAFSNIPDAAMMGDLPGSRAWRRGITRDGRPAFHAMPDRGWDFEDVRDHYVRLLFGMDPSELRARDVERYLALGRVSTGEAMLRTFAEWRRPGSTCRGGPRLVRARSSSRRGLGHR